METSLKCGSSAGLQAVRAEAQKYRDLGIAVCRIRPRDENDEKDKNKTPKVRGWVERSAEPHEFRAGDQIGLVCGWLSDGGVPGRFLVCVDLDSREAIDLADQHLPATKAIEGRAGKPRSHWWFFVTDIPASAISKAPKSSAAARAAGKHPGPKIVPFNHAETGDRLIDFKGSGSQAVVPPTVHESGEPRYWEEGHSIDQAATVTFTELWDAVRRLAGACGWVQKEEKPKEEKAKKTRQGKKAKKPAEPVVSAEPAKPGAVGEPVPAAPERPVRECRVPMDERVKQSRRYLREADLARSGGGGHDTTYRVARLITNDFGVDNREKAMELMRFYNERLELNGEETWSAEELLHKIDSALAAGDDPTYPFGCKLHDPDGAPGGGEWGDPSVLADAFVRDNPLLFFSGRYFVYGGRHYDELDANTLKARVWSFIEQEARRLDPEEPGRVTRALRDNVVAAIEARGVERLGGREADVEFNGWLPGKGRAGDVLVMRNGLLDVQTGKLEPHTPDFLGLYALPYDYDPGATCPKWEAAVDRICGGDAELVLLLQRWFGYCLTTSTDEQKFMVLVGEGANGKSTLVGGLLAVVGAANASHVGLEKFSGAFDLGYTLGKLVNVPDDMSEIDKANEGTLKTYTSGGAMAFNQKNRPILFARPTAKQMFCTNAAPRFSDRSSGLWRRLLLVPLTVVIPEADRVKGMDKPSFWDAAGETAGMLNWSLAGLKSLRESGFVIPACVKKAVEEHQLESNATRLFLTECLSAADGSEIASRTLYATYGYWAKSNGHAPLGHIQFTKEARRVYPKAERKSIRDGESGKSVKGLVGLKWTEEGQSWAAQVA